MRLFSTFLLMLVAYGCLAQSKPDFSRVKEIINDHINNKNFPSISIAVVKEGKILWEEGFGYADKEKGRKATPTTPYYMASVTKTMTATALMKLAEQKLINIDSPLNKYLEGGKVSSYKWNVKKATVIEREHG